jgi:hypothetical protein
MKIIADAGTERFLLHATKDEIARICGYDSNYHMERDKGSGKLKIGTIINVNGLWSNLGLAMKSYAKIESLAGVLEAHAKSLRDANMLIATPLTFDKDAETLS